MILIWLTRGRTWGFHFVLDGGLRDPLPVYEDAFSTMDGEPAGYRLIGRSAALRFPDPLDRQDSAGRVIPHDFVVVDPRGRVINSLEEGVRIIWPLVANIYEGVWLDKTPPAPEAIQSAFDRGSQSPQT